MSTNKAQASSMLSGANLKSIEKNLESIKDLLRANSYSESTIEEFFQYSPLKSLLNTTIATLGAEKNKDKHQEGLKFLQSKFDKLFLDVHNADDKNLRFRDDTGTVYKFSLKTQELTLLL